MKELKFKPNLSDTKANGFNGYGKPPPGPSEIQEVMGETSL